MNNIKKIISIIFLPLYT